MKSTIFFLAAALFSPLLAAAELSGPDLGTFVVLDQKRAPIDMFYRLSKNHGKWVMEGREAGGNWTNISCDSGCEYRISSAAEIQSYFPPDWTQANRISCIQNMAQAFCRYAPIQEAGEAGHIVIAFVTGRPIPIFVRRVSP